MLKSIFAFAAALCMSVAAAAQDTAFRFVMLSDTHIGNETAAEDLERSIRDINAQPGIAFVMISGDITEFGADKEIMLAKSIFDQLKVPWYIIPGNHDSNWSESGCNTFKKVFGAETFAMEYHGILFLGTGCGPSMRMGPGQIPREHIVWLDQQLKAHPDKNQPVIFVNHYPQDSTLNNWYETLDRFRGRNLKAVICGHGHANHNLNFEGAPGIMCRSNLRAGKAVGGYNIVSVTGDSLVFNERTPEVGTLPAWNRVSIAHTTWLQHPPRPDYHMNDTFRNVHEKWLVQEDGDLGGGVTLNGSQVLYTNTNGYVKSISLENGKPRWAYKTGGKIYATPLVTGGHVIVPGTDQDIYAFDPANGRVQWHFTTGKAIVSSAAQSGELSIVAGSDGHCRALETASGKLRWDFDSVRGFVEMKPLLYNGLVMFGSWGNDFYALDAATGRRRWTWNSGAANRMFSPANCAPVATGGKVFIVAPDRYMTCLDAATGAQLWRLKDTANWVRESMGLSEDSSKVYVKTMQGKIMAIDTHAPERRILWTSPVMLGYEICPSALREYKGVLYVPTQSGVVYALNAKDGSLRWKHKFSNCVVNNIVPVNEHLVLAGAADGRVVCLEIK